VVAGTIDAWAEAASVGVRAPGDLMLMYGSTLFLIQVAGSVRPHPKLWSTAGLEPGTRDIAAGMATSGILTGWLRRLAGDPPFAQLVEEAAGVPAGADGLLVLPYFAGERTPLFDPDARGVICGLTLGHGREHLYRAVLEGIAYGVRHNLEAMEEAGGPARRLVAVGGGTRGGLWTQIVSDVTGREQDLPRETIGAAYGDALLAATGTGLAPAGTDWAVIAETVEPDRDAAGLYDELYVGYRGLDEATRETAHALAALQMIRSPRAGDPEPIL
jgi:xylulokinase